MSSEKRSLSPSRYPAPSSLLWILLPLSYLFPTLQPCPASHFPMSTSPTIQDIQGVLVPVGPVSVLGPLPLLFSLPAHRIES